MGNTLEDLKIAIEKKQVEHARELLRQLLQNNPSAEVYYLASQVAINQQQKKTFLEKATELDPFHINARNSLKDLNLDNQQNMKSDDPIRVTENTLQIQGSPIKNEPSKIQESQEDKKVTKSIRQMRGMFGFFGIIITIYALLAFITSFTEGDGGVFVESIILGIIGTCFLTAFRALGRRTKKGLNFARISSIFFLLALPSIILPIFGIIYLIKLSKPEMKQALNN